MIKKFRFALLLAPLALLASAPKAHAYPWSYYGYSSPYSSYYTISGPGGYSGFGYGSGNIGMYSDNFGTTTCFAIGNSISCF